MYEIDPLKDPRWSEFLTRHCNSTVFHTAAWLTALTRTYGYVPRALTSSAPGAELKDGLVFCRVKSWLTGKRLVSLPFADHCMPLAERDEDLPSMLAALKGAGADGKYVEIRPVGGSTKFSADFKAASTFCLHRLDLRPSLGGILHQFHSSCVRRRISKAKREGLTYEEGNSEALLRNLHQLAILTRRRHHLPPQPLAWFRNLILCFGEDAKIRLVSKDSLPLAAILTVRFKDTMTYKYGFSNRDYHRLGGMQLLLWQAIQEAKEDGLAVFDMGRTDWNNPGLIAFKDRWGAQRDSVASLRFPAEKEAGRTARWSARLAKRALAAMPDRVLAMAGNILYRHSA